MKKIISIILSITMLMLTACSSADGGGDKQVKVAIVTESKKSDEKSYRAAQDIVKLYKLKNKDKSSNDEIEQFVIPSNEENNEKKSENVVKKIIADDSIKAVVFSGENKNILKYIKNIKNAREDILLMGANLNLTVDEMSKNLDLSFVPTAIASGKDTVMLAKEMGAEQFIIYYSDKDLKDNKNLGKKIADIENECKNQNIQLISIKVNDINSKEDEYKVKKFISEDIGKQVYKYGKNINLYGTNRVMDDVILRRGIKDKFIIAETSDSCLVDEMNDLYRNIMKTGEEGNYKNNASTIAGKNANYNMDKRIGGLLMPNEMFAVYAAVDTSIKAVEENVSKDTFCKSYFIEKCISEKDAITGSFKNAKSDKNNVKIVSADQIMY